MSNLQCLVNLKLYQAFGISKLSHSLCIPNHTSLPCQLERATIFNQRTVRIIGTASIRTVRSDTACINPDSPINKDAHTRPFASMVLAIANCWWRKNFCAVGSCQIDDLAQTHSLLLHAYKGLNR